MSTTTLEPDFRVSPLRRWVNWHETFKPQSIRKLVDVWNARPNETSARSYNATTGGLQALIEEALIHGSSIRALGGGWSFSDVARTDGIVINTRPLNYRFAVAASQTHPNFHGDATNLAFVQCGISVADLSRHLMSRQKSLKTSGASNGQTIAGALSTGTHGSAIDVGAVPDYVVALHLIVSPQRSVWLERASNPIVDDAYPRIFGAELIRDDALFNAALVSFGSFGIVHGVMVEATDLYFLHASRRLMPLDDGLWQAIEALDFGSIELPRPSDQRPYHFQVLLNPFDLDDGAYVTVMYKGAIRAGNGTPPGNGSRIVPGDSALEVVGQILQFASVLTPVVANHLVKANYKPYENISGTHAEIFADTTTRGKAASTAMGMALGQVRPAVDIALRIIREQQAPALVALRFVRASEATLAFTCHRPFTCVLEVDGPQTRQMTGTFRRIWRALDAAGIRYTFHWGKMNDLDAQRVRTLFGQERIDAWLAARRQLLPESRLRQVFANDFLRGLRLEG